MASLSSPSLMLEFDPNVGHGPNRKSLVHGGGFLMNRLMSSINGDWILAPLCSHESWWLKTAWNDLCPHFLSSHISLNMPAPLYLLPWVEATWSLQQMQMPMSCFLHSLQIHEPNKSLLYKLPNLRYLFMATPSRLWQLLIPFFTTILSTLAELSSYLSNWLTISKMRTRSLHCLE